MGTKGKEEEAATEKVARREEGVRGGGDKEEILREGVGEEGQAEQVPNPTQPKEEL